MPAFHEDWPAFSLQERQDSPLLILADHARNSMPASYQSLGLSPRDLEKHIAYDPGTERLALRLAERLGATCLHSTFSRLLIDPNRGEEDPTLIMRLSEGTPIEGNRAISAEEKAFRLATFHRPYHEAIEHQLSIIRSKGFIPVILSLHSFTPVFKGERRPWHFGLLFERDLRVTDCLRQALQKAWPEAIIGLNEPYRGGLKGDTMALHATAKRYPHSLLEVRNDLIRSDDEATHVADRIADSLGDRLLQKDLQELYHD